MHNVFPAAVWYCCGSEVNNLYCVAKHYEEREREGDKWSMPLFVPAVIRYWRIMLKKGGRFCSKSSEIGRTIQTLWRAIPRILLHFFIHIQNMHETYQKKYRILPIFLPALSAYA